MSRVSGTDKHADTKAKYGVTGPASTNKMNPITRGMMPSQAAASGRSGFIKPSDGGIVERRFETELKELKGKILAMGGFVEQGVERAVKALADRNASLLAEIHELETKINQAHIEIDSTCLGLLARHAPVAADLRMILAIVKINTDLERMGDQAENLAFNTQFYLGNPAVDLAREMPKMAVLVRTMVREALDAFVNTDTELAKTVLGSDDAVDQFKHRIVAQLIERMKTNSEAVESCINLVLMARNLERLADHATNIAEDVIFVSTGQDVRHGAGRPKAEPGE